MTNTATLIEEIRSEHRERNYAMEQRKRIDLALGAYLRTTLGWHKDLPKAASDAIKAQVGDLLECGEKLAKEKPHALAKSPEFKRFEPVIQASLKSRSPWDSIEVSKTKSMENLARQLPVWTSFAEGVRGFGARSLAVIIGETGDLSNYANKGKLWKRMGLAVMGPGDGLHDVRQGGLMKTATKEAWIAHGYNKKRRSCSFVIGDVLVKQGEVYRQVYLDRKEYERKRALENGFKIAPSAKIPENRKAEYMSDGIIHRRAQRYMEKRLLKDLWQAWKRTVITVPSEAGPNPTSVSEITMLKTPLKKMKKELVKV